MAKGRRRGFSSWFVEPYMQVKLGLMFLLVNFIFSVLIVGIFGYYVLDIYDAVSTYFRLSPEESMALGEKFRVPIGIGAGLILVFILITLLVSVRYTYAIYGPLVSIHRYLDDLLGGRRPLPIQLRESDQLKDLALKLNAVADLVSTSAVDGEKPEAELQSMYHFLDELLAGHVPEPLGTLGHSQLDALASKLNEMATHLQEQR